MSSDVYIDFFNPSNGKSSTVRVGHLGTMSYFETNLVQTIRLLSWAKQVIDEHVINVLPAVFDAFIHSNKLLENKSKEYIIRLYGYEPPDWGDVSTGDSIRDDLISHIGENWTIRID